MASLDGGGPGGCSNADLEDFRQYHESDKQWDARKQFLARHMHSYPGRKVDQLIALSVAWSNIVFIGNRYGEQLTEKVHQMAEGIDIGEMPSYELVPDAKATKRTSTLNAVGQPQQKKFGPRPRFEPVHFVVSTVTEDQKFKKTKDSVCIQKQHDDSQTFISTLQGSNVLVTVSDNSDSEENSEMESSSTPYIYDSNSYVEQSNDSYVEQSNDSYVEQSKSDSGSFMAKMEQNYSAKFESHSSNLSRDFRSNVLDMWKGINKQGRKGIGFVKLPKSSGRFGKNKESGTKPYLGRKLQTLDKSFFIRKLSAIVKQKMLKPATSSDGRQINFIHMLTQCIQTCKTNPVYTYVRVKEIPPDNLPKCKIPPNGFACEVRCQDIYLATGYACSKNGARDQAARLAIELLQSPQVEAVTVNRKFGREFREDVVACPSEAQRNEFPPALRHNESNVHEGFLSGQQGTETTEGTSTRPWSEFILKENTSDAIGILNNSAFFNNMTVEYKYVMMPNSKWRCSVYVQDCCLAEGYGNKKSSKHIAAEEAVKVLKSVQPDLQNTNYARSTDNGPSNPLKDLVIYENAPNPIYILNDTAQINNVTIEYVFESLSGVNWKCKVFMAQQFIAEAVGIKKTVKHDAAQEAVNILKKTHPVMINNLHKGPVTDAISRNQIRGLSNEDAYKQQIKEDNIGNQLLRKMGWTGGGLGKGGDGIAEPISVKEQHMREGLGLMTGDQRITKRDIEQIIRNYAASNNQDDLTFSRELTNEERKNIHQIAQKYGLKSKSHGQGVKRFLVVSRKRNRQELIHQLKQEGQVGSYVLLMPQN
ncbi:NF-kappa-B-repressing factor [Pseudophryne corroboree]|uniref:NF-kappa-B-repressing factor n=1 Tax=Pseudophryne corroboree TaxID=495146 RepID=UPI003081EFD1